jgi:hypothetical protein
MGGVRSPHTVLLLAVSAGTPGKILDLKNPGSSLSGTADCLNQYSYSDCQTARKYTPNRPRLAKSRIA